MVLSSWRKYIYRFVYKYFSTFGKPEKANPIKIRSLMYLKYINKLDIMTLYLQAYLPLDW